MKEGSASSKAFLNVKVMSGLSSTIRIRLPKGKSFSLLSFICCSFCCLAVEENYFSNAYRSTKQMNTCSMIHNQTANIIL